MKKLLLTLAAAAITMSAAAATVEFNLSDPASFGVTPADNNDRVYPASFSKDGVTVTINNGEGVADNAKLSFFTGASGAVDFRCGKSNTSSNIVITAPANITKIDFTGTPAFNEVSNGAWTGDAASVKLTTKGQVKLTAMTVTYGEVAPATPVELYSMLGEALTEMPADWTMDNVSLAEGLEYVWSWKVYYGKGYLNASAYANGGANAAEAYVVSPVIDLTKAKECTVSFDHAAKFQTTLRTLCGLVVREEGATEWTALEIPTWPDAGAWTFANSGDINLAAYDGKKIQLGFKYGSTAEGADTWEIKNLVIKGIGSGAVTPDPDPEVVTVNNIKETVALESGAKIKVNYALTVGYVVRNQVFVCDEAGDFIQLYGANTLAVGDVIPAGWEGTYKLYKGDTPEIEFSSLPDATAGVFTPKTVAAADITTALVNNVINIDNVVFAEATPADLANFTGKVGDTELSFRNNYKLPSVEAGTYTVTVVVTIYDNAPSLYVIEYNAGSTAVDNIAVDAAAPVEYFNLQGIRVANPENGVFIRRQGSKVSKIVIR